MSNATIQTARCHNLRPPITAEAPVDAAGRDRRPSALRSDKITDEHLERLAIVYVRQSTQQQVLEHRESTARQYALADRAVALGWPSAAVEVIDEDQGHSGSSAEGRSGFQRLLAEVSSDRVGLILGLEMSRLARSCKDWHALLEVVLDLSHAAGRRRRTLRSEPVQRPVAARLERDDERSGICTSSRVACNKACGTRPSAVKCSITHRSVTCGPSPATS